MSRVKKIFLLAALSACLMSAYSAEAESVAFEVDADTPVVLANSRQTITVRALVRPESRGRRRVPLAVALVLDKSGSMASGGKMENAKSGALEALYRLDGQDVATVVVYDSRARVAVPARSAADKSLSRSISLLQPGGNTALYDGVKLGAEQLRPFVGEGYIPRIILLSDGLANVGPSSARELANFGRVLARREMTVTTIGLGLDYDEDLMTALAAESGGNAYFAKHAGALSDIFARDMDDATMLTARKVRVMLTCQEGARATGSVGRGALREDRTSVEVSIDNLYGEEKYALFEVEIPETFKETVVATVKLEYLDPSTGRVETREAPLRLTFTKDAREVEKNRHPQIAAQKAFALNAEIREEAVRLVDEGQADKASKLLSGRAEAMKSMSPAAPAPMQAEFENEAKDFETLAESLSMNNSMTSESRKGVLNKAFIQKNQQTSVGKGK
ncbi:MAG: VWA domain-containing protein [Synergistaceae bacterium]|jgi:Ca-activated chloride channel family protein|nr:VWA domain-containing protein [Synergistaceae bacterium]